MPISWLEGITTASIGQWEAEARGMPRGAGCRAATLHLGLTPASLWEQGRLSSGPVALTACKAILVKSQEGVHAPAAPPQLVLHTCGEAVRLLAEALCERDAAEC